MYTGITDNLPRRIAVHNAGKGAKYTRSRLPVRVVYFEQCTDKSAALKREYQIKSMRKTEKQDLIAAQAIVVEQQF